MGIFRKQTTWEKLAGPLQRLDGRSAARSGLAAGATVLALSVVSAATSAVRRREERS
jgi:hypothetical protein